MIKAALYYSNITTACKCSLSPLCSLNLNKIQHQHRNGNEITSKTFLHPPDITQNSEINGVLLALTLHLYRYLTRLRHSAQNQCKPETS